MCIRDSTARAAKEGGYAYFCSTLSVSPHKNAAWLNEIGEELQQKYGVSWLHNDFKKRGGYLRSTQLAREYGLYRQNYCGCIFSERAEQREKAEKRQAGGEGRRALRKNESE